MGTFASSRHRVGLCLFFSSAAAAALPACHDAGDQAVTTEESALVTTRNVVLPGAVSIQSAALGATDSLQLADRVQVLTPEGLGATVSNMGTAETNIGMESVTGDLWAGGPVVLRGTNQPDFINVRGDLRTAATVTLQNHAAVSGGTLQNQTIPTASTPFSVDVPATVGANKSYGPNGPPVTLPPGNYGDVHAYSGVTLTFKAGTYFVRSLLLEPGAKLILDNASQPVFVYVRADLQVRAPFQETATGELSGNSLFVMLGSNAPIVEAPFIGTLLAPQSQLTLATVGPAGHTGAFFAKGITVNPDVVIRHRPFRSLLIDHVDVSKTQVCSGEPVKVTVTPRAGVTANISIDLQVTNERWFQYPGAPGKRFVTVVAAGPNGVLEVRTVEVTVKDCGTSFTPALLTVRPSQNDAYAAELRVRNAAALAGPGLLYAWDFGDGTTAQTAYPYVEHSYEGSLGTTQEYKTFTATLRVKRTGLADIVVPKTVTVWNHYAYNRGRGIVSPTVDAPATVTASGGTTSASLTIRNREAQPLSLTQQIIERQFCNPDQDPQALPAQAVSLTVPANGTLPYVVTADSAQFGQDVCGMNVTLRGTVGSLSVIARQQIEVRVNRSFGHQISDPATAALIKQARADGLVGPGAVSQRDLDRLFKQGRIATLPDPNAFDGVSVLAASTGDALGQPCIPGDDPPRPGLSCQVVDEPDVCYPPGVWNALKGDILLVAACEFVGGMFRQLNPPQKYTHEGLMTQNYFRLSHSTVTQDNIMQEFKDEHEWSESFLKYGHPGALHRTIAEAWADEDFSQSSVRCDNDESLIPPLVVSPLPGTEGVSRPLLKGAADVAASIESHYRFFAFTEAAVSFDPSFDAPPGAPFGESGPATVSSQFIWTALHKAGVQLEGTPEPGERSMDANTLDGLYVYTEDERRAAGKYVMNYVNNQINDSVTTAQDVLLGLIHSDMITVASEQMMGCFAKDICDPDFYGGNLAEQILLHMGLGHAVSPDNFLAWDAAPTGAYGYSEIMRYRDGKCLPATRWKAAPGTGTLQVHVHDQNGDGLGQARVLVDGADLRTNASGDVTIEGVSAGAQVVLVQCGRRDDGTTDVNGCDPNSGTLLVNDPPTTVTVAANTTTPVDIEVVVDSPDRRKITVDFTAWINNDEFGDADGDTSSCWGHHPGAPVNCKLRSETLRHGECHVNKFHRLDPPLTTILGITFQPLKTVFSECENGEVNGTVGIACTLLDDDRTVSIRLGVGVKEGASCDGTHTDDNEFDLTLGPDESHLNGFLNTDVKSTPTNGAPYDQIEIKWPEDQGGGIRNQLDF